MEGCAPFLLEGTFSQTSQYKDSKIWVCAYAPDIWKELPENIKAADSVQNFKEQLKASLFRKEFIWLYGP